MSFISKILPFSVYYDKSLAWGIYLSINDFDQFYQSSNVSRNLGLEHSFLSIGLEECGCCVNYPFLPITYLIDCLDIIVRIGDEISRDA